MALNRPASDDVSDEGEAKYNSQDLLITERVSSTTVTPSYDVSIVKNLRLSLFNPASHETTEKPALTHLPIRLLKQAASYLNDKDRSLIKLAQTSKIAY